MRDSRADAVMAAEEIRCQALVARDFNTLRTVISRDLTHTHTRGNTEDYELYFSLLQGPMQYLSIERRDTEIRFYGPVAVMSGIAVVSGRLGDKEPMMLEIKALQVWVETTEGWQMVAFQGTQIA
jgi:hypothetical protein